MNKNKYTVQDIFTKLHVLNSMEVLLVRSADNLAVATQPVFQRESLRKMIIESTLGKFPCLNN